MNRFVASAYKIAGVFVLAISAVSVHAQIATTTSLVGTVTDSTGKSIQNAKVTAVHAGTLDAYTMNTNDQGYYSFEFARVGVYNITVEHPGFQKVTKTGVAVNINQSVRTDFQLAVGAITQSVTVEAEATVIKTDDATVSEIFGTRTVEEAPLNGRDPMQLALGVPGV